MSKSLPLMIDTSKAVILTHKVTQSPDTPITSTTTTTNQSPTTSTTTIPSTSTTTTTTIIKTSQTSSFDESSNDKDNFSANIKVILARQHYQSTKLPTHPKFNQLEVLLAISIITLLIFLVIYSTFSIKRRSLSECDKAKLIGTECETDFSQTQTIHV